MPDRIDDLIASVQKVRECVIRIETTLTERCPDHERRLEALENGTSRGIRFWGSLLAIVAGVAGAVAAAIAAILGGH